MAEEWIRKELTKNVEDNDIILENRHRGREKPSTLSAKLVIDNASAKTVDENKFAIVLSTDLSMAYNSVDHPTLRKKLKYYRIQEKEHKLIESFLSERHHYIEVKTRTSMLTPSPD